MRAALAAVQYLFKITKNEQNGKRRKLHDTSVDKMLTNRNNCFAARQQKKIFITANIPSRTHKPNQAFGLFRLVACFGWQKNELTLTTTSATFCCTWCTCFTSGNWWFSTSRATIKRAACQQNANNQSISINQGGSGRGMPTSAATVAQGGGSVSARTTTSTFLIWCGNWNSQTEN